MSPSLCPLSELDPGSAACYGGKAVGLARLLAAGARVPPGFAVAATSEPPSAWPPEEVQGLLDAARPLLAGGPVAVRSSALGEDSAERSWAGVLETALGVEDDAAVLAAAERCIASGRGRRARAYSPGREGLRVGLVIQRMVEPRAAGVCCTRDPTGADRAVVIEAAAGRGDRLVAGAVQPERWRAYRSGLGGWECRGQAEPGALSAHEATLIATRASTLEAALGEALDLEWAVDRDGELWWLQARPITALTPAPELDVQRSCADGDDGPVTVWSNWNVRETLPDPLLPLTWSLWREVILPLALEQVAGLPRSSSLNRQLCALDLIQGRVYFNMNGLLAVPLLGWLTRRALAAMDAEAAEAVRQLTSQGVLRPRRIPGSGPWLLARLLAAGASGLLRFGRALRPRAALAALERAGWNAARRPPVTGLSDQQLVEELRLLESRQCRPLLDGLQMEAVAIAVFAAARRVWRDHPEAASRLGTGIPAGPTTQVSLAIDHLATAARPLAELFLSETDPGRLIATLHGRPEAAAWLAGLQIFIDQFGHRGPREFDLGAPRWRDDPTVVVELVRARLRSPCEPVADRLGRLALQRSVAMEAALASAPPGRRWIMRRLARLVELYMPLREAPKHYSLLAIDRARRAALELGGRLRRAAVLEDASHVFFLDLGELDALARGLPAPPDLSRRLERRRGLHRAFLTRRPPDFVRSDGVPVEVPVPAGHEAGRFQGVAVSPGRARGPVRVLASPDPSLLRGGEVLVMRSADPGWTPLFAHAAALVVEVGGLMCHAAVVAREMGVPAVFGVRAAANLLQDGETVEVDGTAGVVARR